MIFNQVRQGRISDSIVAQIKNAIFTGIYRPGDKLPSEAELKKLFNVSRVPLREALRSLEEMGLIHIKSGVTGGAFVAEMGTKLVSDSLYDADKFRWGPDNFTVTLWLLIESAGLSLERLYHSFIEKMEGIKKIKKTFRTKTGQQYGPEFIDKGIAIGNEIYREMRCIIPKITSTTANSRCSKQEHEETS